MDDDRAPQPDADDERDLTLGWLRFHRDALAAKCAGLDDDQLVLRAAPPSPLSLLGLVRHLAEMERAYGSWPQGTDRGFSWVWGDYADGAEDDVDCTADDVRESFETWMRERAVTDTALEARPDLDARSEVNGHSVRWNLAKLVGEYARHNGHADLLRERIDGATGE
ncbi:DUF664 domain-containing protein [Nocardioides marinquilinus]|uniref:mycothiol transferase n=1 Tax=Nocardioides marinquilinus TaxID=1210400 RepID=UPI0031EBFFED